MEIYRVEKKSNNIYKTIVIIMITIGLTLYIERAITNDNETKEYIEKLSYAEVQKESSRINKETTSIDLENILDSTVGISLIKPSGANILDVDIEQKWGLGTGIIVSEDGYILTNQHLAQKVNSSVVVTLNSGKSLKGRIVWVEENLDLALLKIDGKNLKKAVLGNSRNINIGETVYAVGNPLGAEFRGSITKGIVSGLNRTILFEENGSSTFMEGLIQTDASINPGNSGGPLINEKGEVIGINTVKISSAEGIGFAVPVSVVKNVIDIFEEEGVFEEPTLGIYAYDSKVVPYMDNEVNFSNGIYIASINENGPCKGKNIKKGDIITAIDDIQIDQMIDLREYLYTKKVGDSIKLTINNGTEKEIYVILGKK